MAEVAIAGAFVGFLAALFRVPREQETWVEVAAGIVGGILGAWLLEPYLPPLGAVVVGASFGYVGSDIAGSVWTLAVKRARMQVA